MVSRNRLNCVAIKGLKEMADARVGYRRALWTAARAGRGLMCGVAYKGTRRMPSKKWHRLFQPGRCWRKCDQWNTQPIISSPCAWRWAQV